MLAVVVEGLGRLLWPLTLLMGLSRSFGSLGSHTDELFPGSVQLYFAGKGEEEISRAWSQQDEDEGVPALSYT